jgi:hypothetical protein
MLGEQMQQFFDRFEAVRDSVKFRLTAKDAKALSLDGTAGPMPFDIEPLEKWLYEAYFRQYQDDETLQAAFWAGVAEAMEASIPPTNESHGICIKRSADLLDQIANNFGAETIGEKAFERANVQIGMQRAPPHDVGVTDVLTLQGALLRFSLLTSPNGAWASVLQAEDALWTSIHRCLANDPNAINAMLGADTLCTLFRAWALMGRREVALQSIVRGWCQSGSVDKGRLESYMKRTLSLLKLSKAKYDEAIWYTLESCVSGQLSFSARGSSGIPRYRPSAFPAVAVA